MNNILNNLLPYLAELVHFSNLKTILSDWETVLKMLDIRIVNPMFFFIYCFLKFFIFNYFRDRLYLLENYKYLIFLKWLILCKFSWYLISINTRQIDLTIKWKEFSMILIHWFCLVFWQINHLLFWQIYEINYF